MTGSINWNCVQSLGNMAAVSLTASLWKKSDTRENMVNIVRTFLSNDDNLKENRRSYDDSCLIIIGRALLDCVSDPIERDDSFDGLDSYVLRNASKLELPYVLLMKMCSLSRPIGLQLMEWIECPKGSNRFDFLSSYSIDKRVQLIDSIRWTPRGTIDYAHAADSYLQQTFVGKSQSILLRAFRIACAFCKPREIRRIWWTMPRSMRIGLASSKAYKTNNSYFVAYWAYLLSGYVLTVEMFPVLSPADAYEVFFAKHPGAVDSVNEYMLVLSISEGNFEALKYFWSKISKRRRRLKTILYVEHSAHFAARNTKWRGKMFQETNVHMDVFVFLLSQLDAEQFHNEDLLIALACHMEALCHLVRSWPWHQTHFEQILPKLCAVLQFVEDTDPYSGALMLDICSLMSFGMDVGQVLKNVWSSGNVRMRNFFVRVIKTSTGLPNVSSLKSWLEQNKGSSMQIPSLTVVLCWAALDLEFLEMILEHEINLEDRKLIYMKAVASKELLLRYVRMNGPFGCFISQSYSLTMQRIRSRRLADIGRKLNEQMASICDEISIVTVSECEETLIFKRSVDEYIKIFSCYAICFIVMLGLCHLVYIILSHFIL